MWFRLFGVYRDIDRVSQFRKERRLIHSGGLGSIKMSDITPYRERDGMICRFWFKRFSIPKKSRSRVRPLFSDTELREYSSQNILGRSFSDDVIETSEGVPHLERHDLRGMSRVMSLNRPMERFTRAD